MYSKRVYSNSCFFECMDSEATGLLMGELFFIFMLLRALISARKCDSQKKKNIGLLAPTKK